MVLCYFSSSFYVFPSIIIFIIIATIIIIIVTFYPISSDKEKKFVPVGFTQMTLKATLQKIMFFRDTCWLVDRGYFVFLLNLQAYFLPFPSATLWCNFSGLGLAVLSLYTTCVQISAMLSLLIHCLGHREGWHPFSHPCSFVPDPDVAGTFILFYLLPWKSYL